MPTAQTATGRTIQNCLKTLFNLGCTDIAAQLISFPYGDGLEVAMGGGRRHFIPEDATRP